MNVERQIARTHIIQIGGQLLPTLGLAMQEKSHAPTLGLCMQVCTHTWFMYVGLYPHLIGLSVCTHTWFMYVGLYPHSVYVYSSVPTLRLSVYIALYPHLVYQCMQVCTHTRFISVYSSVPTLGLSVYVGLYPHLVCRSLPTLGLCIYILQCVGGSKVPHAVIYGIYTCCCNHWEYIAESGVYISTTGVYC